MASPAVAATRTQAPPPPGPGLHRHRSVLARFSAAHGLMVASGLAAFVLVAAALAHGGDTVPVAVAGTDLAPGSAVGRGQVRWERLPARSALAAQLVSPAALGHDHWVAADAVAAGQPLRRADLAPADAGEALRWLSVPVAPEHAAGGTLRAGDVVDVIDVSDGAATYVASGVEVAKVAEPSAGGGLRGGGGGDSYVVVRVDAAQALAIARAMADSKLELVRATGAGPLPLPATAAQAPAAGP